MKRYRRWAVVAAVAIIFVAVVAARPRPAPPPPPPSLDSIEAGLPATTRVFVGVDVRNRLTMAQILDALDALINAHPALKSGYEKAVQNAGMSPREMLGWASPVAYVALMPTGSNLNLVETMGGAHKPFEVVAAVGVSDEAAARTFINRLIVKMAGSRTEGETRVCESNLKNLDTALEMYATDHQGHYPESLSALVPQYLTSLPVCPAAGRDTYTATYQVTHHPEGFSVACGGDNHHRGQNFPAYSSSLGLIRGNTAPPTAESVSHQVEIDGNPAWVLGEGDAEAAITLHNGYLLIASGQAVLDQVLQSMDGHVPGLAADPLFADARRHVSTSYGLVSYVSLQRVMNPLAMAGLAQQGEVDAQTIQAAAALQYVVSSCDLVDGDLQTHSFLKLDTNSQSPFIKALLAQPANDTSAVHYVPGSNNLCLSANVKWLYPVVVQALQVFPSTRPAASFAQQWRAQGFDLEHDVLAQFTGGVAIGSNVLEKLPELVMAYIGRRQGKTGDPMTGVPAVILAAHLQSVDAGNNLVTEFETHSGHHSEVAGQAGGVDLHVYKDAPVSIFWSIVPGPEPMLLVAGGPNADALMQAGLQAAAQHQSVADGASWQRLMEAAPNGVIMTDYLDLQPLVKQGSQLVKEMLAASPPPENVATVVDSALSVLEQVAPWLHGTSTWRVTTDGLEFTNRGTLSLTSMALGGGLGAAAGTEQRQRREASILEGQLI
ncbi:MAG: DUF3352 domain-containing protein, partial [Candidatus Xenobia bacterium]